MMSTRLSSGERRRACRRFSDLCPLDHFRFASKRLEQQAKIANRAVDWVIRDFRLKLL